MNRRALPLRPIALLATCAPLFAGGGTPGSSGVPLLEHSAPLLGQTLDVELSQALGGAFAGLAFSPQAGSIPFPFGTVHLDPNGLVLLAQGLTAPAGTKTWSFALPLSASLAEAQAHLQAFVLDPVAAAGIALSNSLDLRLMAGRVYVGWGPYASPAGDQAGALKAYSTVGDALVWSLDLGTALPGTVLSNGHEPAFDAVRSRGAVMATTRRLVVFDVAFGTPLGTLDFAADCSPVVRTAPDGQSLLVLETGAAPKLWTVGFDLAAPQSVYLPASVPAMAPRFEVHAPSARAIVPDLAGARLVDLSALADLGVVALGGGTLDWGTLQLSGDQAFVTAKLGFPSYDSTLHRLDLSAAPVATSAATFAQPTGPALPVPATGELLLPYTMDFLYFAMLGLQRQTLAFPGSALPIVPGDPAASPQYVADSHVRGSQVWFLDRCCNEPPDSDEPGRVSRYDALLQSWTAVASGWTQVGPAGLESAQDALCDAVYVATTSYFVPAPFTAPPARLVRIDATSGAQTPTDLTPGAAPFLTISTLHAAPLP